MGLMNEVREESEEEYKEIPSPEPIMLEPEKVSPKIEIPPPDTKKQQPGSPTKKKKSGAVKL